MTPTFCTRRVRRPSGAEGSRRRLLLGALESPKASHAVAAWNALALRRHGWALLTASVGVGSSAYKRGALVLVTDVKKMAQGELGPACPSYFSDRSETQLTPNSHPSRGPARDPRRRVGAVR